MKTSPGSLQLVRLSQRKSLLFGGAVVALDCVFAGSDWAAWAVR